MNRSPSAFFDPMDWFSDVIDLTRQTQKTGVEVMLNQWEGGLDFFAHLLQQAEEITARNPDDALRLVR